VRTVLTEGRDTATYAATMETADSAVVRALFSNVYDPVRTVSTKPANFDTDNSNHNVSLLTGGTGGRIGPSMVLKVMAGDKVQISTFAFYNTTTQPPVTDNTLLNDLLSTLVSGVTAQSGGKITSGGSTQLSNTVSPNILSFLNSRTYNSSLPKAYLNWVLLDDQFKYVAGNMGAVQVIAGSSKQALVAPLQTIAKNGYLYIYVSNQSPQNVYFDDLVIKHYTGPLLQEQSYYPFGLEMAGISGQAMGKLDSKNKFNGGTELEEDYGVNLYSTFYRKYDPQIGRFSGVDCQSEASIGRSVYQFGANNPISNNDPYGDLTQADLDRLWNSPNRGTWSESSGSQLFDTQDQAFMYGAMEMTGSWGPPSGRGGGGGSRRGSPTSFEDALYRYNGGRITAGMAQEYQSVTWGIQAENVTASSVKGGFNVALTATSTGNSYSVFVSEKSIKEGLDFLQNLYGNTQPPRYEGIPFDNNQESNAWLTTGLTVSKYTDDALTLNGGIIYGSQKLANSLARTSSKIITKIPVLDVIGDVTGVASIAEHSVKFYQNPNWNDGLHVVGQVTALVIGGEFEIGYNLVTLGVDSLMDWLDD